MVLEVHPCVKYRVRGPGSHREGYRQLKSAFLAAQAERLLLLALFRPVPHGSRIVEHQATAINVIDRAVRDVRSAERVQIELVPASQGLRIAQHETFEQGRD